MQAASLVGYCANSMNRRFIEDYFQAHNVSNHLPFIIWQVPKFSLQMTLFCIWHDGLLYLTAI